MSTGGGLDLHAKEKNFMTANAQNRPASCSLPRTQRQALHLGRRRLDLVHQRSPLLPDSSRTAAQCSEHIAINFTALLMQLSKDQVTGKPPPYATSHPGQLSPLPYAAWEMSTGQSVVMLCSWGVKAGMAHTLCGQTCGRHVKLCDPSLTRAIVPCLSAPEMSIAHIIKCYTKVLFIYLLTDYTRNS